jgi:hypothetical protein
MNELKAKRHYLKNESRKFGQDLVEIPEYLWPQGLGREGTRVIRAWRNRDFLVQMWSESSPLLIGRLSINHCELNSAGGWKDGITWDELQELKRKAGYGENWAVECFPPDVQLVNVANIRHLWIMTVPLGFGW